VWLIYFWDTTSKPCLRRMADFEKLLEKKQTEWGDKVRIIALGYE
jgi:hypothetical protein